MGPVLDATGYQVDKKEQRSSTIRFYIWKELISQLLMLLDTNLNH